VAPPSLRFNQILAKKPKYLVFKEPIAAMWSFNHSAIYRSLYLRLAIANDLSLGVGHKDRSEGFHNATKVSIQLLSPNAHPRNIIKIEEE
jgi:hypothetical protein